MEVHTHTHTPRKKWTHYFWEFLMLFLAVFCGFLAEYQLEHKIEKERAGEYAIQLYSDLTADSADYNAEINNSKFYVDKLDTLIGLLNNYRSLQPSPQRIYQLSWYALYESIFEPLVTTMEQLKGSGNLRYLGDSALRKIFSEYDVRTQIIKTHYEISVLIENELRKIGTQVLNIKKVFTAAQKDPREPTVSEEKLELISADILLLKQFANWCTLKQRNLEKRIWTLKNAQVELRKLILKLKEKFHLL